MTEEWRVLIWYEGFRKQKVHKFYEDEEGARKHYESCAGRVGMDDFNRTLRVELQCRRVEPWAVEEEARDGSMPRML